MKAAVLKEPGKLEITEIPAPPCPPGGVLVKISACGICSADLKMLTNGHRALKYPRVLGHEIVGRVVRSLNPDVKEGDRVHVAPGLRCNSCSRCRKGADNQCGRREICGFTIDGGFADYIAVPLQGNLRGELTRLPDTISDAVVTLAEPMACCINAHEKVGLNPSDHVLIIGAGPLGLLHAFVARSRGAGKILISEIQPQRREAARGLWVDAAVDPMHEDIGKFVMHHTGGSGVDCIILACSRADIDPSIFDMLAPGGKVSFFSGFSPSASDSRIDANLIHYHEITIAGAYGCCARHNREAVDLMASTLLPLDRLITRRVSLENLMEGFEHTLSTTAFKAVVEVDDD